MSNQQEMWQQTTLGDVLRFQNGKSIKPGGRGPIRVFGSNGLIGGTKDAPFQDAVVIGRVGAYCGSVQYAEGPHWASDNTIVATPLDDSIDLRFAYYLLKRADLNRWAGGAAQPLMTQTVLKQIPISLPSKIVQKKIAAALAAYDELIVNNVRRIEILEEMAQTIYREWFVNFRLPPYAAGRILESGRGDLPSDWILSSPSELLEHHIGGGWGQEEPTPAESDLAPVIRGTDIPKVRLLDTEDCPRRFHKASSLPQRVLQPGDIVFEVSGGSKDQPVGRSLLVSSPLLRALGGKTICASFCKLLRSDSSVLIPEIFYLHLRHLYDSGGISEYQVQSTGISNFKFKPFLEMHRFIVPPPEVQESFRAVVQPLFEMVDFLGLESKNLQRTRDILLPKLISGEIDVSELDIDTSWLAA